MPYASNINSSGQLLRTLIFGEAKVRKSSWACMAAEAGFNVVLLDGDDGSQVVRQLPPKVQEKVLVVDVRDTIDRAVFKEFLATFIRAKASFNWNERDRKSDFGTLNPECSYIKFSPSLLTSNDVLILDSWKAFTKSTLLAFVLQNDIDLSDAEKEEWPGYSYQSLFQDFVLKSMHCLKCHIIVIGHETVYEKWDRRNKKEPKLLSRKTQIVSSSGPHAKTVMTEFTDILYVERLGPTTFTINTGGDSDRIGGSRLIEPRIFQYDQLPVTKLLEKIGAVATGLPCLGAEWFASGADLQATQPALIKFSGDKPPVIPNTNTGTSILSKLVNKG